MPGGGKGLGSTAPVPAVGDPGGPMLVKKKERARIRVQGQGDTIAIGGPVRFQPFAAKLAGDQEDAVKRIAEDLRGKPQVVEIVATASGRRVAAGESLSRSLGTRLCPLPRRGSRVDGGEYPAGAVPPFRRAGKWRRRQQRKERGNRRRAPREPERHAAIGSEVNSRRLVASRNCL